MSPLYILDINLLSIGWMYGFQIFFSSHRMPFLLSVVYSAVQRFSLM